MGDLLCDTTNRFFLLSRHHAFFYTSRRQPLTWPGQTGQTDGDAGSRSDDLLLPHAYWSAWMEPVDLPSR